MTVRQKRGVKRPFCGPADHVAAPSRCDRGKNLLGLCVLFGFTLELFIAFTQPLPTVKIDFPQAQSAWNQLRGLSYSNGENEYEYEDNYDTYSQVNSITARYSPPRNYPRVAHMMGSEQLKAIQKAIPHQRKQAVAPISDSDCFYCTVEMDTHVYPYERPYYEQCTFMADWQATFRENCNMLHELDITSADVSLLSTQGSWRTVWKMPVDTNKSAILKLLRFERRNFTHEALAYHRTDAMVMSQLTSSPYIVNAFSSCGHSVITEFASSGARDFVKKREFSSIERLKMGRDVAKALSALHSMDYPHSSNASLAHNDINIANAVQVDGQLKLNDFNIAIIMKWNQTQPCNAPVRFQAPLWKSPEEIRNASYFDPSMADVYGLGSLIYQILTKHQPWTHLEPHGPLTPATVALLKLNGTLPYVPSQYAKSNKTSLQALYYGTMACFRIDPKERLNSYELSRAFDLVVKAVNKNMRVPRETIKRFFEKDFWHNASKFQFNIPTANTTTKPSK